MNAVVAVAWDWTHFKQENISTSQEELQTQLSSSWWCQGSWLWHSLSQHYCKALCSSTPATVSPLTSVSSLRWRQLCSVFILTPCSVCKVQTLHGVRIAKPVSAFKGGNTPRMGWKQLLCSEELWHGTTVGDFNLYRRKSCQHRMASWRPIGREMMVTVRPKSSSTALRTKLIKAFT